MINPDQILERMEVVGSDGKHVGTVDKLVIKLTKNDPPAKKEQHAVAFTSAAKIEDGKLFLNQPASEAKQHFRQVG